MQTPDGELSDVDEIMIEFGPEFDWLVSKARQGRMGNEDAVADFANTVATMPETRAKCMLSLAISVLLTEDEARARD